MRTHIDNHKKHKIEREWRLVLKCAILFLCAFLFSIIVDKSRKMSKINEDEIINQEEALDGSGGEAREEKSTSDICVVIDPGHGGNDPGKVSADGILEKDVNLQIAIKLREELESRGVGIIMLREEDVNLATEGATNKKTSDMKNRVAIINECNPDVLISIHQNSYTDSDVRGPQVFYHDASTESEVFAKLLQEKLKALNSEYAREAKTGNDYYILNKSICPGVIVECGFLSCPQEASLLVSEEYQQKIASAIADAIMENY